MMDRTIDAPGTCHIVGCPGKGTRDEHAPSPPDGPEVMFHATRGGIRSGEAPPLGNPGDPPHDRVRIRHEDVMPIPTVHYVGPPVADLHVLTDGCSRQCVGTWPGGQPFHVKGCPNDQGRFPATEPAKVLVDQADAAALLDYAHAHKVERGTDMEAVLRRVSRALAVARNTP